MGILQCNMHILCLETFMHDQFKVENLNVHDYTIEHKCLPFQLILHLSMLYIL